MDLESFARREFARRRDGRRVLSEASGQDEQLQVRWIADLVEPAATLLDQPDLLASSEAFDRQTDALLRALAGSLEVMTLEGNPGADWAPCLGRSASRGAAQCASRDLRRPADPRQASGMVLRRSRIRRELRAAQTLASVLRKIEFLNTNAEALGPVSSALPLDAQAVASLSGRIAQIWKAADGQPATERPRRRPVRQALRRLVATRASCLDC